MRSTRAIHPSALMTKQLVLSCSLATILACSTLAAAAPSVAQLEAALNARDQRVALLRAELKADDARIEERIASLVQALRSVGDSKDTRSKVARMKRDTIDRLQKTIAYYNQKRAAMREELRRPTWNLTEAQKREAITKFDERIEKRVAQILALQKSLPQERDYDRYKVTGSNWVGPTYAVNEDHVQNQRLTVHTNQQRDEVTSALRASIERLDRQNRTLRAQNGPAAEIAKNDALIAERRKQLAVALAPVETKARSVGSKEAADLDNALKIAIEELKRDMNKLFAAYHAVIQEASAANSTRAALSAAKAKAPKP